MKPPACTQCKWGPGTVCDRPSNTQASKELEAKLKEMQKARQSQDAAWFAPPEPETKNKKNNK